MDMFFFFFSSIRLHTRCALVTGVQTCVLPISSACIRRKSAPSTPLKYPPSPKRCKNWLTNGSRKIASQSKKPFSNRPLPPAYVHNGVLPRAAPKKVWPSTHAIARSEEHTSELQSLMRISYAVFCLKKKTKQNTLKI